MQGKELKKLSELFVVTCEWRDWKIQQESKQKQLIVLFFLPRSRSQGQFLKAQKKDKSLQDFLPEECPNFLDCFSIQDCLPKDSISHSTK